MIIFKPREIFNQLEKLLPANPVIVEGGAFCGHDTLRMCAGWPHSTIHSFEPVPELFDELCKQTKDHPNVTCYKYALSNKTGTAPLYVSYKKNNALFPSQASSLHKPKERLLWSPIEFPLTKIVPTITLSDWAQHNNIEAIDLLWLDLQGHELPTLQGAGKLLEKTKVIYTEVAFNEAYEDQAQYESVCTWLKNNHFTLIGKDFENSTDWFFGNLLFVRN